MSAGRGDQNQQAIAELCDDVTDALAAANELTNNFLIYNDEFNTLVQKRTEANAAIVAASTDPAGVDHAAILHLQSLVMGTESRMAVQNAKMIAFQSSTLVINATTPVQVDAVKQLTGQLCRMVARDQAIANIMAALGQVAGIVNQIQGG